MYNIHRYIFLVTPDFNFLHNVEYTEVPTYLNNNIAYYTFLMHTEFNPQF